MHKLMQKLEARRAKRRGSAYYQSRRAYYRSPRARYLYTRREAQRRGKTFDLTLPEYEALISRPCHYCGCDLAASQSTSLDRIDNDKGYSAGNVLPCCRACNQIRGHNLSVEEMLAAMEAVRAVRGGA